jgi:4,4'-diaponeurosporenoate glycosyltransferase
MQWIIFLTIVFGNLVGLFLLMKVPSFLESPSKTRTQKISIIIPARNEEKRLAPLLASLRSQQDEFFELIVVDDHSTDLTASLSLSYGAKVITAKPLPKDWFGKPWACYQGAKEAQGDVFMFLDADTWIEKNGLKKLITTFNKTKTPMSVQPYHKMKRFYEQFSAMFNVMVAMTTGQFTLFGARLKASSFFGPCQIVESSDYWAVGGHEVAKNKILEDIALGEAFLTLPKKNIRTYLGKGVISFRMYNEGFASVVEGWSKNFATGAGLIPRWLLIATSVWISGLFVSFFSGTAPFMWVEFAYPIGYAITGIIFYILARKTGNFSILIVILYPLFLLFFIVVFLSSVFKLKKNKQVTWKGRTLDL